MKAIEYIKNHIIFIGTTKKGRVQSYFSALKFDMLLQITSAYNGFSASGAQLKSLPQYVAKTQGRRKV